MITYDDFAKVEIKAGKILSAEKIPETDKLIKLSVDFGVTEKVTEKLIDEKETNEVPEITEAEAETITVPEIAEEIREIRQIVSGISMYFPDPQELVGKVCMFVTNLKPRMLKGYESNGMLFALSTDDGKFSLLEPNKDIPEGTKAK